MKLYGGAMNREIKISSLELGLTYAGSFFGAGFVSGKEIYEFFGTFGKKGYIGLFFAIILFFIFGSLLIRNVQISKKSSFDEAMILGNYKIFRSMLGAVTIFMMFGIFVVMAAGAGALINQVSGIPHYIGCFVFTVLVCIAALFGISGAVKAFSIIVPVLVVVTLIICALSLNKYGIKAAATSANENPLLMNWWFSALTYVSYNMITLIGTIIPVGSHVKKKRNAYTGILYGCIFALSIAMGILFAVTSIYGASSKELPMLDIAFRLNSIFGYIYAVLLLLAMFGTSLSSIVAISVYAEERFIIYKKYRKPFTSVIGIIAFLCSLVGFGHLVDTVYPIFGYIGFIVLALIVANFIYLKMKCSK